MMGVENNPYLAFCPMLNHHNQAGIADIFTALYYTHLLYPNILPPAAQLYMKNVKKITLADESD
jgi:hypothetical protein